MRRTVAILTRAACLLRSDGCLKSGRPARFFAMSGLIRAIRKEMFPDARKRVPDGEPDESAWAWAYALIPQTPIDKTPEPRDLIHAARKLRVWAAAEELIAGGLREPECNLQPVEARILPSEGGLTPEAEASLRSAIASTPLDHPDHEALMSSPFMRKGAA